jgi:peptidyl-dipeptidase A
MSPQRALLSLSILFGLAALAAQAADAPAETAPEFIARVNRTQAEIGPELASAQWLSSTYINGDSQRVAAAANERLLTLLNQFVEQAQRYPTTGLDPATARALELIKLGTSMPAPRDPARIRELTEIATRMEGMYGAGRYCADPADEGSCRNIGQLSAVLADSANSSYEQQLEAWTGWHTISIPMRRDYQRFVELVNEGAGQMGYADAGAMWRSGYDMPANDFRAETDRLWGQVRPLYEQLHCYTRDRLVQRYGAERGQVEGGLLPAHLMGNLWQQDWGNLWPMLEPYPGVGSLDINSRLEAQRDQILAGLREQAGENPSAERQVEIEREANLQMATRMTRLAESFYTDLGMPALPDSFYSLSQLTKPRDRDVVCHASAWPMDTVGRDVRIKMCIEPTEEELTTIYHELGHIYYYLAYKDQPPLFQGGAHDGFHEAIGDTIVLSMTPEYLASIGLLERTDVSEQAVINAQMRMALAKVAFLPFGLMIDRWRWGVFDGSIAPENYNSAWWALKAQYQGVAPATPRGEEFFDPGAKYHVPGNTPYTRYFLSHILQFQFYKALCDAAGHEGPLYTCNFAGNEEAGRRYWAMMQRGSSQPWQQTLRELTGGEQMDGSAVLEYFAPLMAWLQQQNQGRSCGWERPAASSSPAGNG